MKKLFSLLVAFCGACLLVGCGGGSASTAPNISPLTAPLTITSGAPSAATLQVAYGGSSGFSLTASGAGRRIPGAGLPPRVLLCHRV